MLELGIVAVLAVAAPQAPGATQGLAIDHRPVKCIVAEKYPKLNACFAPSSQLARARVYFRVADGPPDWYYVEMKSDAPCFTGILPRPKRELIGRHVQYYLDASDRQFTESRTTEAEALVVKQESDCEDRLLAAPWLDKATVAVLPRMPAGFLGGGIGAGTAAIAGGAALVVGGGVALIASNSGSNPATSTTTTTTTTTTTLPVTTTTTTTLPVPFVPVFKVYRDGVLQPGDSIVGPDPLPLLFDMCASSGPFPLRFNVEVDGVQTTDGCQSWIRFTASGAVVASGRGTPGVRSSATAANRVYAVAMRIRSVSPDNQPRATRKLTVEITPSTSPGCSGDTRGPVVSLTSPAPGTAYPGSAPYPVHFEASASDTTTGNNGVATVEYKLNSQGNPQKVLGPVTSGAPWPLDWSSTDVLSWLGPDCSRVVDVQAYAADACGNATYSAPVQISVGGICDQARASGRAEAVGTLVSELGVAGGGGQVVVNDDAEFPRGGRHLLTVRLRPGENQVEATLVEGRGAGQWRFHLANVPGFQPGSLRVIAGEASEVGGDALAFRLRGRPGERIVFSFRVEPPPGR